MDLNFKEGDLTLCVCGHTRAVHLEWPSGWVCYDSPDEGQDCPCDSFHEEGQ